MFVEDSVDVPLRFAVAREALEIALFGELAAESRRAADIGDTFLMRVGPFGSHHFAKSVRVRVVRARCSTRSITIAVRWEPTGPSQRLFPDLDADLTLDAGGPDDGSQLRVVACYRPPLAAITAGLDRAIMSKAARKTLAAFLAEIVKHLVAISNNIPTPAPTPS